MTDPRPRRPGFVAILAVLAWAAAPCPAGAQSPDDRDLPRAFGHAGWVAINGSLAAAAVAAQRWMRGEPVELRHVLRGFGGGALSYGGRRLAAARWDGAGFAGRQVAQLGHGALRSAVRDGPLAEEVELALGPLLVGWRGGGPSAAVDVAQVGELAWAFTREELAVDVGASLSAGAFVFQTRDREIRDDGDPALGVMARGVILIQDPALLPGDARARTLAHERVHVIQRDFMESAAGFPLDAWATGRWAPWWPSWLRPGAGEWLVSWATRLGGRGPREWEADFLEGDGR